MKRSNFRIRHAYENMFGISCTAKYMVDKGWGKYEEETDEDYAYEPMYYPSLVTLRVDLLTFCNNTYGTSYEVTDEMRAYADSFRGKLQDRYNIGIEVGYEFNTYGGFYHKYRYTGEGASLGVCQSTYGYDWDKDQFIELADTIVEFFKTDPLITAKAAMQEKYNLYRRLNIGHTEGPLYTDDPQDTINPNFTQVHLQ